MRSFTILSLAGVAVAQYKGFNYGSTSSTGAALVEQDYVNDFNRAKTLQGQSGFTSARLYTMIEAGTPNSVTPAIQAAIDTQTTLLLGLWASAGQDAFNNELMALTSAISQYGTSFTDLITGISVGSEDLYRETPTGIENNSGVGASPDTLVMYIGQLRDTIRGTAASGAPVGHVDTWTAWVNGSNAAVISAVDFLGMDGYPYYQTTQANSIQNAATLFFESYNATVAIAQGKGVWVTETGWPYQGPTANQAVASIQNAETYWQEVACKLLGNVNTYWFSLQDAPSSASAISFGVVGSDLNSAPLYDLACSNGNSEPASSSSAASSSASAPATAASSKAASTSVVSPPVSYPTSYPSQGGQTKTAYGTTLVTVTSCPESATPSPSSPASSGNNCPTNLDGPYQFPHLIVPVNSASPSTAYGTSYDGTISPTISSIFNFDIPSSYAGKTCSLVFLFPDQADLQTSSYTFNGEGGIKVTSLQSPATEQTTYQNQPAAGSLSTEISSVAPGNEYLVFTQACAAGQRIGYEFSSVGGLDLEYFQDYNPSPIGAYITVC